MWTDFHVGGIYGALKRLLAEDLVEPVRTEREGRAARAADRPDYGGGAHRARPPATGDAHRLRAEARPVRPRARAGRQGPRRRAARAAARPAHDHRGRRGAPHGPARARPPVPEPHRAARDAAPDPPPPRRARVAPTRCSRTSPPSSTTRRPERPTDMSDSAPALGTIQVAPRRAWIAFAVILVGAAMSLIDATIVNVALPSIRTSIDASEATLSWIISGYALAFGLALIPAGRLGDRYGHKWVFFGGLALFTAASVTCGLSQSDGQLIVSRVVQGLAGGIYLPAVSAYIQLLFGGRVRGRAFAIFGAVLGVSSAIGPVLGGLLIEAFGNTDGWRFVFYVNLPIGIVALIAAAALVPNSPKQGATGLDVVGLLLLTGRALRDPRAAHRGPGSGLARVDLPLARGRRRAARAVRPLGAQRRGPRQDRARAAAPVQPPGVHRGNVPRARLLRGLREHLLLDLAAVAVGPEAHRARVRPRLHPVRDRQHRRGVAEHAARGPDRPLGARDRCGDGRARAHRGLARAAARAGDRPHELGPAGPPSSSPASAAASSSRRTCSSSSRRSTRRKRAPRAA